jgi:hypothetical protein
VTSRRRYLQWLLGPDIDVRRADFVPVKGAEGRYVAALCPRWNGQLYLMVNDAAPLLSRAFYRNNSGAAKVKVIPDPKGRICRQPVVQTD